MELHAILLLVLAAVIHSVWNLLTKKSLDKQVFLWLSLVVLSVVCLPVFIYLFTPFPSKAWIYIISSGALEAVYCILLTKAYQNGDLSLVYPIARGSAPVFATLLAVFFLNEYLPPEGIAGITLIAGGIYTLHIKSLDRQGILAPLLSLRDRTSRLSVLTGFTIACYSVVDKVGISHVSPFLYVYLIFAVTAALLTPYMVLTRSGLVAREWRSNKIMIFAVSLMFLAGYLLVLLAMRTSKVSYVTSVREMSVVFAAFLGVFMLREPFGRMKITGSIFIFTGIVLIALAR